MSDLLFNIIDNKQSSFFYDAVGGLIRGYFPAISNEPIQFEGKIYDVRPLFVSPLLFDEADCRIGCGACCVRGTLDYLPNKPHPVEATRRFLTVNNKKIEVWSDMQLDHQKHFCRHVIGPDKPDMMGACKIWQSSVYPFMCDLNLVKIMEEKGRRRMLSSYYSRTWTMARIDDTVDSFEHRKREGMRKKTNEEKSALEEERFILQWSKEKYFAESDEAYLHRLDKINKAEVSRRERHGALCSSRPFIHRNENTVKNTLRKLNTMKEWADHFQINNRMNKILEWANSTPTPATPLVIQ